jgi:hypothetical protein
VPDTLEVIRIGAPAALGLGAGVTLGDGAPGSGKLRLTGVLATNEDAEGTCRSVKLPPRSRGGPSPRRAREGCGLSSGEDRCEAVPGRDVVIVGGERTIMRGLVVAEGPGDEAGPPTSERGLNGDVARTSGTVGVRGGPGEEAVLTGPTALPDAEDLRCIDTAVEIFAFGRTGAGTSVGTSFRGDGGRTAAVGPTPFPKSTRAVI